MSKQVKIATKNIGSSFGVVGVVKQGRQTLHTTETKPYGMPANAYRAAERWATERGYTVA